MKFHLMQYRIFRQLMKGTYYRINPVGLPMATFWNDMPILSCQSKIIDYENYSQTKEN